MTKYHGKVSRYEIGADSAAVFAELSYSYPEIMNLITPWLKREFAKQKKSSSHPSEEEATNT